MKIRKDDKVIVISGKDKGKTGPVVKVFKDKNKVLVEGVNKVKKHVKPGVISQEGGIIEMEKPIHVSNVMLINPKTKKPERVGFKIEEGKKIRVFRKTGNKVDGK